MRVELKQWLRSHWGEMSANDRAKFPNQTLYLSPGGAGITSMREQYEHWLQILMMVSGFVLLIVCANVANLMLVRGMERRRQTSLSMALGARASRVVRQALTESILLAFLGGAAGLGDRICRHAPDSRFRIPLVGWVRRSTHQRVAFHAGAALRPHCFASDRNSVRHCSRVDGHASGSHRSASRHRPLHRPLPGRFPERRSSWCRPPSRLSCYRRQDCSPSALQKFEDQDFGFEQDRRIVVTVNPRLAGYRTRPAFPALPPHSRFHGERSRRIIRRPVPILAPNGRCMGRCRLGGRPSSSRASG